jgi:putative transposase
MKFLNRDRDQKFNERFDELFRSDGLISFARHLARPQANGAAERFVRTVRSECLDRLLILNRPHLERILGVLVDHYNGHRPHRALCLAPPDLRARQPRRRHPCTRILRRDLLGDVVHEYALAA